MRACPTGQMQYVQVNVKVNESLSYRSDAIHAGNVKVNESLSYRSDAIRAGQCTNKIGRGGVCTFCPTGHTWWNLSYRSHCIDVS